MSKTEEKRNLTLKQLKEASYLPDFDRVISDLKNGLMRDFTDEEACHYAGISHDTFYRWRRDSEEFAKEMQTAQSFLFRKAKQVIANGIIDNGDKDNAKWLLERRRKENYATRQENTGKNGGPLDVRLSNFSKEQLDEMPEDELLKIVGGQVIDEAESVK